MEAPAMRARMENCMVIDVCLGIVGMSESCDNVMLLRDDVIWSEELRQGGPESDTYSILFEMHRQQMIHDRVGNRTRCR
jgi:hypothetical protein